ncbi:hypothetical protein [Halosimplex pelagicum]|uniref:Uncharacterized protein n=1 Tax=Halosimplex pelagicum TaxID=869886 RepID=A0A7D5TGW0_9EURY|nr:hypothetical protein [Halosimplex pelagicum]QLH82156.1 hypothetical protein HZS54_11310 [Halosimplex pelagicum]
MATDTLDNLDEGDYVHSEETGEVYEVEEIDVEFSDDGIPTGTVTFRDGDSTFTRNAEEVDYELHDLILAVVDEDVINHAEQILVSFAEQEIGNYIQRLGVNHDYNGIEEVETLRDIKAAAFLDRRSRE